ncbi:MAG: hypothetical protein CMO10_09475 [Thalassospira sp.]|nr:hypothetical protein [Thalassospira sp.]|tara:strand:+ start:4545 stop:4736 length:192 start_codon:yes stop_codon:yes gene_type:complete
MMFTLSACVVLMAFVRVALIPWGRQQRTEIWQTPYAVMPEIGITFYPKPAKNYHDAALQGIWG